MAEESAAALVRGSLPADGEGLSADAFRGLETAFENTQVQHAADIETATITQRRERVKALIDEHIDDTKWRTLLLQARQARCSGCATAASGARRMTAFACVETTILLSCSPFQATGV